VIGSDIVTVANSGATFGDWNVGTGKTVTLAGVSLGGTDGGNYSIAATATTTAKITAKPLGLDLSGQGGKVYDGTTAITLVGVTPTLTGVIGGDTVTLNAGAVTGFADKNAGTNKAVAFTGFGIAGADVGNYALVSGSAASSANITQAGLTLSTGNVVKTYDGGIAASGSVTVTGGTLFSSDTLSGGSYAFANKNVGNGNKAVSVSGVTVNDGNSGNNYALTYADNTTSTINPLAITLTGFTADNKVYDRSTMAAILNAGSLVGVIGGDVVTLGNSGASFGDWNVGTGKTVTLRGIALGSTDSGNYSIAATATTTANITAKSLGLDLTGQAGKVYDGTTAISLSGVTPTLTGVIGGDTVTLDASLVTGITDKNAGTNKAVVFAGFGITGTDIGNYSLVSGSAASSANISPRALTVTYTGVNKIFDGSTTATTTAADDRLAGDVFAVASSANFADQLAGTNKPVAITGARLAGTDAGNYILLATTGATTATITPLPSIPAPPAPTGGGTGTGTTGGGLPPLDGGDTGTGGTDTSGTGGTGSGGTDTTGTGGTGSGGTDTTGAGGTGPGGTDTAGTGGTGSGGTNTAGTGGTGSDETDKPLSTIPAPRPPTGAGTGPGTSGGGLPPLGGSDTETGGTGTGGKNNGGGAPDSPEDNDKKDQPNVSGGSSGLPAVPSTQPASAGAVRTGNPIGDLLQTEGDAKSGTVSSDGDRTGRLNSPRGGSSTVEFALPGGATATMQLPAGMTVTFDAETVTISLGDQSGGSGSSATGDVSVTTTMSVIILKNGSPAAAADGLTVSEVSGELTLAPIKGGAAVMAAPGAIISRIMLVLQDKGGAGAAFEIGQTSSGIVIRPQSKAAEAALAAQQNLVIGLALAEVRKQLNVPLEKIRSIFIDKP
jgi:ethanolamine utilization microcompartment shell protein EutS